MIEFKYSDNEITLRVFSLRVILRFSHIHRENLTTTATTFLIK